MKRFRWKRKGIYGTVLLISGGTTGVRISTSASPVIFDAATARLAADALLKAAECIDEVPRIIVPPKSEFTALMCEDHG